MLAHHEGAQLSGMVIHFLLACFSDVRTARLLLLSREDLDVHSCFFSALNTLLFG
jgi:hypothetical protein